MGSHVPVPESTNGALPEVGNATAGADPSTGKGHNLDRRVTHLQAVGVGGAESYLCALLGGASEELCVRVGSLTTIVKH